MKNGAENRCILIDVRIPQTLIETKAYRTMATATKIHNFPGKFDQK